jgi:hypothetical protein
MERWSGPLAGAGCATILPVTVEKEKLEELVDLYARAWTDPDPGGRRRNLEETVTEAATYTDPTAHVEGHEAFAAHIDAFHERMPGHRIERVTAVDAYGTVARFGWQLVDASGTSLHVGLDFVELADDGRIARIVGFFGPLD